MSKKQNNDIKEGGVNEDVKENSSSAKVLLEVIHKENDRVYDIKKQLESRAAVFIAFSGALLAIFFNKIEVAQVIKLPCGSILLVSFVFSFSICIYGFIKVIQTRKYEGLDVKVLDKKLARRDEKLVSLILVNTYVGIIESYIQENEKKTDHLERGIEFLVISVFLLGLLFILPLLIK